MKPDPKQFTPPAFSYWQEEIHSLPWAFGTSLSSGNKIELLVDGIEFFPAYIRQIDSAQKTLSFQFLNMEADEGGRPIADALIRAARRGVQVKGLLDWLDLFFETNGQFSILPWQGDRKLISKERKATKEMFAEMRQAGIEFYITAPSFRNGFRRNHRKSVIADQKSLIVGGFNPTGHNLTWHEVCVRLEGPVVGEAQKIFNHAFSEYGRGGFPIETLSGVTSENSYLGLAINEPRQQSFRDFFVHLISKAKEQFQMENAYFSDPACFLAMKEACKRGVKVQLIVPKFSNHGIIDRKRDENIPDLIGAGGEVFLYPGMTHAKLFSVDHSVVSIGSANLTPLNLWMERELNVVVFDPTGKFQRDVFQRVFEKDIKVSEPVHN